MNKAIITNLSHDLQKHIEKIDGRAHQIKEMADNILEYSLGRRCVELQIEGPRSFRAVFVWMQKNT